MEAIETVEVFSNTSARFRYRVPVSLLRELRYETSRYSPEFDVAGWLWRFHIQERVVDGERFLALHLQSCSAGSVPVHFKLSVICIKDPLLSKSKTFNCIFKKAGSAWGLHQFLSMDKLLNPDKGFIYEVEGADTRCVDFEVTLQVQQPRQGHYSASSSVNVRPLSRPAHLSRELLPASRSASRVSPVRGTSARALTSVPRASMVPPNFQHTPRNHHSLCPSDAGVHGYGPGRPHPLLAVAGDGAPLAVSVRSSLVYPFDHLESLCDMSFDVHGVRVKAHRCVIGARMRPLLPEQMLPLQAGCIVAIAVPLDVFTTFLRYIYTEEHPEEGVLPPESLLDLYLLSAACEYYDLGSVCIRYVRPLLTPENILPIVLTRYNAADEVLTSLYLRVLVESYDTLIMDKQFEEIPGHLFRRLSLILHRKESVPHAPIPPMKNTLSKQLAWLVETGEYSDCEWIVGLHRHAIRAHRFVLASRSAVLAQCVDNSHRNDSPTPLPDFSTSDYDFSLRCWQKFMAAMYRRHLDVARDFSAEDVAIVFKMHSALGMDGHLKREAEEAFDSNNTLRLLIYGVKHQIPELRDRAIHYAASNFNALILGDPQAWELISELPQVAVVSLFRTVIEYQQYVDPRT